MVIKKLYDLHISSDYVVYINGYFVGRLISMKFIWKVNDLY